MALEELTLADTPACLTAALDSLRELPVVGVDVERSDWDRYYRAAALIQIGGAGKAVLVDPLALDDLSAVQEFLGGRATVLHACDNDLEPLAAVGIRPPHVEDTAVAAAVLGLPMGLEALLGELLGIELAGDKSAMQRADWEARPLSEKMQAYAAGDVADLPALWAEMEARLHATERASWYRQEMAAALALPPAPARRAWTRTKGAGRLNRLARARFRSLWETRERLGRDTDTAPGRIAGDKTLLDLATTPPAALAELGRRGVRRQAVREFGDELLAAVSASEPEGARSDDSAAPTGRRPTEADRDHAEQLRALRTQRAEQLGVAPGVLCPNRMLLAGLLADPDTPEQLRAALGLRDWQWEQLGDAFCEALDLTGPGRPAPVAPQGGPDDG